jgi:hypothetical protein
VGTQHNVRSCSKTSIDITFQVSVEVRVDEGIEASVVTNVQSQVKRALETEAIDHWKAVTRHEAMRWEKGA